MALTAASTMFTLNHALDQELTNFREAEVDLLKSETKFGRDLGTLIMDIVKELPHVFPHLPEVYRSDCFVAGSLGRRTQERPLDDVDVFIPVNAGGLQMWEGGQLSQVTLRGHTPNPLATDLRYRDGVWVSSHLMLKEFFQALYVFSPTLQETFDISLGAKMRNVKMLHRNSGINCDLVFVVFGDHFGGGIDRYYLPLGNGSTSWKATNPREDQRRLSGMNQERGGRLVPVIRMMKWWNKTHNADRLKGIHLEVMVEQALEGVDPDSPFATVRYLFREIHGLTEGRCMDPTGLGPALDSTLTWQDRMSSLQALETAADNLATAGSYSDLGDITMARSYLRRVFPV